MRWAVTFWVWDAIGNHVANYPRQAQAAEHAVRIGGTWTRGRL